MVGSLFNPKSTYSYITSTYSVKVSPSLGINLVEKLKPTTRDNLSGPGGTYKLVMMVIDGIRPR